MAIEKPCRVFCCYARKDQEFLLDLKVHLKSLEHDGLIDVKSDMNISPGAEWERDINNHLRDADIILLLVSPDFIASDYCYDKEMKQAIARHEQGTACVIPVILRPANWHSTPFGKIQALPKDAIPISIVENKDTALVNVTKGIRAIAEGLTTSKPIKQTKEADLLAPAKDDLAFSNDQKRDSMDNNHYTNKYKIEGNVNGHVGDVTGEHAQIHIYNREQKDGIRSLEEGALALKRKEYRQARLLLKNAVQEIPSSEKPLGAKARYFQALAILGKEAPRDKGLVDITKVYDLLDAAIDLDSCKAYFITKASIKGDIFESNPSSTRQEEVYRCRQQAGNKKNTTAYDDELLSYLKECQPGLYHQVW